MSSQINFAPRTETKGNILSDSLAMPPARSFLSGGFWRKRFFFWRTLSRDVGELRGCSCTVLIVPDLSYSRRRRKLYYSSAHCWGCITCCLLTKLLMIHLTYCINCIIVLFEFQLNLNFQSMYESFTTRLTLSLIRTTC